MGRLGRFNGFWNGLTGPARRLIVGAVLLFAVGLFLLWRFSGEAAWANLVTGANPSDAAAVTQELQGKGIPYRLADNGSTVQVPADKVDQARLDLASSSIGGGGSVGFEIFDRQSLGATDFTQRVNLVRAMEGELARTITRLEPVQTATVNIAVPQERLFSSEQQPTTASILVDVKTGQTLDAAQVRGITNLAAMSVPGLKADNITITDERGNILSAAAADDMTSATTRLAMENTYERQTQTKLDAMLAAILGPGMAMTQVDVILDLDRVQQDTEDYNPQSSTPLNRSTTNEQLQSTGGGTGATAGTTPNTTGTFPATAQTSGDTRYRKTTTTEQNGVDRTREQIVRTPGTVTRQSISVQVSDEVPQSAVTQIQNAVQAAVGYQANRDQIEVQRMPFAEAGATARQAQTGTTTTAAADEAASKGGMDIMSIAKTAGVAIGVLLLLFLVSRSLKRRQGNLEGALPELLARGPVPVAELAATTNPEDRAAIDVQRKSHLQEQMEDLALSRPEDVAQLLRGWLLESKH